MKKLLAAVVVVLGMVAAADAAVLTWTDNSDNELGFKIYRKSEVCAGTGAFTVPIAVVGPNSVTWVDGTVVQGQNYCYRLTAYNSSGESQPSNAADFLLPFIVPQSPSGLTVKP